MPEDQPAPPPPPPPLAAATQPPQGPPYAPPYSYAAPYAQPYPSPYPAYGRPPRPRRSAWFWTSSGFNRENAARACLTSFNILF